MPDATPANNPAYPAQPFCEGCLLYDAGACLRLAAVREAVGDDAVVSDCGLYDPITKTIPQDQETQ